MERETGAGPAAERTSASRAGGSEEGSAERLGPVALERLRKDDGRRLILYRHIGDEDP
jgi:hypothetical protein